MLKHKHSRNQLERMSIINKLNTVFHNEIKDFFKFYETQNNNVSADDLIESFNNYCGVTVTENVVQKKEKVPRKVKEIEPEKRCVAQTEKGQCNNRKSSTSSNSDLCHVHDKKEKEKTKKTDEVEIKEKPKTKSKKNKSRKEVIVSDAEDSEKEPEIKLSEMSEMSDLEISSEME